MFVEEEHRPTWHDVDVTDFDYWQAGAACVHPVEEQTCQMTNRPCRWKWPQRKVNMP